MNAKRRVIGFGACLVAALTGASFRAASDEPAPAVWSKQAAANYLDARQTWWMHWPKAARDHDTFCVSCLTVVPYLLAHSALRSALAQPSLCTIDDNILAQVPLRANGWLRKRGTQIRALQQRGEDRLAGGWQKRP